MLAEKLKVQKPSKVSKCLTDNFSFCTYNSVMKAIRNKDVRVNGTKITQDIDVCVGDEIIFYHKQQSAILIDIIYEDENIVVVNKPRKLETIADGDCLLERVSLHLNQTCYAVHRLDRNTTGLVIFAKNIESKNSLDFAFKNRMLDKFYLALVSGTLKNKSENLVAYLKKDSEKSFVKISNFSQKGYEKIETRYKTLQVAENLSLAEVELVTGKTHQIRAHMAFIGHPIIGDEKYGKTQINSHYKTKYQCLCSYKIIFHFENDDYLSYLDGKVIEIKKSKIDFLKLINKN